MNGDRFAQPNFSDTLVGLPLDTHAIDLYAERRGYDAAHRVDVSLMHRGER
jgi:hypothetical protein